MLKWTHVFVISEEFPLGRSLLNIEDGAGAALPYSLTHPEAHTFKCPLCMLGSSWNGFLLVSDIVELYVRRVFLTNICCIFSVNFKAVVDYRVS